MTLPLKGKVALVTGAATGLGRATASEFARAGAAVVVAGLEPDELRGTAGEIGTSGGQCATVDLDVTDHESVVSAVEAVVDRFDRLDIVANFAGIYPITSWDQIETEEWDRVFAVNVRGTYWVARAAARLMRDQCEGGSIVNISSVAYFIPFRGYAHYAASKAAVIGVTRTLAKELGEYSIRVNAIAPGAFPTRAEQQPDLEAYNRQLLEQQALKRRGRPEDIASAALFLASDASSFITGQTLVVDGGWYMH